MMLAPVLSLLALATLPSPLPSTFTFIDRSYAGDRFINDTVVVFGGTSGIGFAAAAMLLAECAGEVVVVGRNHRKGALAAAVLATVPNPPACASGPPAASRVRFAPADIRVPAQVRSVFASLGQLELGQRVPRAVVNTAGIAGWMNLGLGELLGNNDAVGGGRNDAVANNLGGAVTVTQEALLAWGLGACLPVSGRPCPALAPGRPVPSLVHTASEQGMVGCPACAPYATSKHGIVGMVRSAAASYTKSVLRVNAVLPGLVDTPLTWNQVRPFAPNGTTTLHPRLQPGFQCINTSTGTLVKDGLCPDGGTGFGCPCPDVRRDDPRNPVVWKGVWPPIDPRVVARTILGLAAGRRANKGPAGTIGGMAASKASPQASAQDDPFVDATGLEFVVDNAVRKSGGGGTDEHIVYKCESTMANPIYKTCPQVPGVPPGAPPHSGSACVGGQGGLLGAGGVAGIAVAGVAVGFGLATLVFRAAQGRWPWAQAGHDGADTGGGYAALS